MKLNWCLLQAVAVEHLAVIHVTGQNYRWLPEVQNAITSNSQRHIILVAQGEPLCGIVGLVNCIRREQGSDFVRLELCYFNIFMAVKIPHIIQYSAGLRVLSLSINAACCLCMHTCIVVYNENIYTTIFNIRKRIYECASKD
jgi:hypothetical protein